MLGKYYRFRVLNGSDATMTYADAARVEIAIIPWNMASGAMVQAAEITDNFGFTSGTIVATAMVESTVIDNTSDLDIGFTGTFRVVHDFNTADGPVTLWLEMSTDNSTWPSDQTGAGTPLPENLILLATLDIANVIPDLVYMTNIQF